MALKSVPDVKKLAEEISKNLSKDGYVLILKTDIDNIFRRLDDLEARFDPARR